LALARNTILSIADSDHELNQIGIRSDFVAVEIGNERHHHARTRIA
jgi:hypothetical protein